MGDMKTMTPGSIMDMMAVRSKYLSSLFGGGKKKQQEPKKDW